MAKLLFVTHTSDFGGPNYRLLSLLNYLKTNHEPAVLAPDGGPIFKKLADMGVTALAPASGGLRRQNIPWFYHIIRDQQFDLVYGNNFSSGIRNALIATKLARKPFIWHINEMLRETTPRNRTFFLRFADAVIADSKACATSVQSHVPNKPVNQIYNGIELEEFNLDRTTARGHVLTIIGKEDPIVIIISAGILCARKGQLYAIEAAFQIIKRHPNTHFIFLGSPDEDPVYAQSLLEKVAGSGVEDNIHFLGFRKDFAEILVGSDIFLHTALKDPQPIAVLGAMGAGIPVVAFAVDGVKEEIEDQKTGFLVPTSDVSALTNRLILCLESPQLRSQMGKLGKERIETLFTSEITNQSIEELIESLLLSTS